MIGEIDAMAVAWHACRNQLRGWLRPADHSGARFGGMRTNYSQLFGLCHPPAFISTYRHRDNWYDQTTTGIVCTSVASMRMQVAEPSESGAAIG